MITGSFPYSRLQDVRNNDGLHSAGARRYKLLLQTQLMRSLYTVTDKTAGNSGFYPPKSRIKIELTPLPLKLPLPPLPPAAIKKHLGQ